MSRRDTRRAERDGDPWSVEDQELARDWTGNATDLAKRLGRSAQAVAHQRHQIKLFGIRQPTHGGGRHETLTKHRQGDPCPNCHVLMPLTGVCDDCA